MDEYNNQKNKIESDKNDSDWNEVSFGKLLGFKDDNQALEEEITEIQDSNSEVSNNQAETTNPIATHELFDSPHERKTQPNFYSNPFAKFGAVGLVMLVVFGSAATVLNSIMSGSLKTAPPTQYSSQSKPKLEIAQNPQERETGKLKAELALSTQAEKIKSIEGAKSPKTAVSKPKPKVKPTIKTNTRPTSAKEASIPIRNQIASRPAVATRTAVPYIPRPKPQPLPVKYSPPKRVVPIPKFQSSANRISKPTTPKLEEKIDPMEEWTKISRLGSYGSSVITANPEEQTSESTIDNTILEVPKQIIPKATLISAVQFPQSLIKKVVIQKSNRYLDISSIKVMQIPSRGAGNLYIFDYGSPQLCGARGCLYSVYNESGKTLLEFIANPQLPTTQELVKVSKTANQGFPCLTITQNTNTDKLLSQTEFCYQNGHYIRLNKNFITKTESEYKFLYGTTTTNTITKFPV